MYFSVESVAILTIAATIFAVVMTIKEGKVIDFIDNIINNIYKYVKQYE